MTMTVDGQVMPTVRRVIEIENSGSCNLGECTYQLSPTESTIPAAGHPTLPIMLTTPEECFWELDRKPYWVTLNSAPSGSGPAIIEVAVEPNGGSTRVDDVVIGGRNHTILQVGCTERFGLWSDGEAERVVGTDNHAFVTNSTGLVVLDTADPGAPAEVASLATGCPGTEALDLCGALLLMAGPGNPLSIVDVSSPAQPNELSTTLMAGEVRGLDCAGNVVYVAADDAGLRVIDISDPTVPVEIAAPAVTGSAQDVAVSGDLAVVAAGGEGLHLFDVSNPSAPTLLSSVPDLTFAAAVSIVGVHALVVDQLSGLKVFDISSPSAPDEIAFLPLPETSRMSASSHHMYAASEDGSLLVVDISDPARPTAVTAVPDLDPRSVSTRSGYVYVARGPHGVSIYQACEGRLFCDGFPTGDTRAWSDDVE
jgi:hypothetical protein